MAKRPIWTQDGILVDLKRTGKYGYRSVNLVEALKKMPGAFPYDSDSCVQVYFELTNGMRMRFVAVDDDNPNSDKICIDNYGGLPLVGKNGETVMW